MKSSVRQKILDAFREADGDFLSGEKLASKIGCSRTAVWKHMEDLRNEGFQLEAIRRKGYRLINQPHTMSDNEIYLGLKTKKIGKNIHHHESLQSTQILAKELAINGSEEGTLVICDEQTAGRGRMARKWHSPKGSGIWMSLIIRPDIPLVKAPQLTLLTAVAVVQAIEEVTNLEVGIKWPNDLLINGKKLCGILTELLAEENRIQAIIIGIGLNVNQKQADFPEELLETATSLAIEAGNSFDRTTLLLEFCHQFEKLYEIYLDKGFESIKLLWESYALSIGKEIIARTLKGVFTGKALGINEEGVLMLQTATDGVIQLYSADIELNGVQ